MRTIVINRKYGGFGLSDLACQLYSDHIDTTLDWVPWNVWSIRRDDPVLVQIVRDLGAKANGAYSDLHLVDIPADVEWQIDEYDGWEWIAEKHRTWR